MASVRKAGEKDLNPQSPYTGVKEYGAWSDSWNDTAAHQQMKASGSYDANSDYAKRFAGFKEDLANSRVDNEKGWRQLSIDDQLRDPKAYAKLVNEWSAAGFDVRAIDMNKKYGGANIAVRRSGGSVGGGGPVKDQPVVQNKDIKTTVNQGGSSSDPQKFLTSYMGEQKTSTEQSASTTQSVNDSMNAKGGTLTNTGDLTAGRDITLDNSVTNQNTLNQFGGDVRQFTYNAPGFAQGGGRGGSGGAGYPSMNSYKDPALNATPVSAATMAGFYQPSDSPAAAAKRTTLHSELNRSKQEKYQNVGSDVAKKYIQSADKSRTIDTQKLNANLAVQPYVDEARSNQITADTFGDIWKFQPDQFYMPNPFEKPEQPDFEGMFDKISDKITGG